jgi:uncharacterized protein YutD
MLVNKKHLKKLLKEFCSWGCKKSFIEGAKYQQERSYSEEEVKTLLLDCRSENPIDVNKWFEQFKKK